MLTTLYNAISSLTEQADIEAALKTLVDTGALHFEPWLWIKNLWMADSPFTSVLPLSVSDIVNIKSVVDADLYAALEVFVASETYQGIVLPYFNAVPMPGATANFIIFQLTIYKNPNGFFILPVLAAATQYLSTVMNPQQEASSGNEANKGTGQMMKYFMPLFSIWICSSSNAAFALYWVMSNVIQMVQTLAFNWYFKWEDRKKALSGKEAQQE